MRFMTKETRARLVNLGLGLLLVSVLGTGALGAGREVQAAPPVDLMPAAEFDLAAYRGEVVVLDFWASWCKPCRKALPWLSGLQARWGEDGLVTVAVNLDRDAEKAREMLARLELDPGVVLLHDPRGELAEAYELQGMPSTFVFGRDGELRSSHLGFRESEAEARAGEIEALLEEEVTTDAKTR
jgi:thiol-disulfide isomerase/thioredoxin